MPCERSLSQNQYYAHGRNQFWQIMFEIFEQPFSNNYEKRCTLLLDNRIALWDVLKACIREGSSDSAIQLEEPNDFNSFFKKYSSIKCIAFNGNKSGGYFENYRISNGNKTKLLLPSTSPANTWKNFETKLSEWKVILKHL